MSVDCNRPACLFCEHTFVMAQMAYLQKAFIFVPTYIKFMEIHQDFQSYDQKCWRTSHNLISRLVGVSDESSDLHILYGFVVVVRGEQFTLLNECTNERTEGRTDGR